MKKKFILIIHHYGLLSELPVTAPLSASFAAHTVLIQEKTVLPPISIKFLLIWA